MHYKLCIIKLSPNKSCELDPLPTWLLKLCAQELAPIITAIVNALLSAIILNDNVDYVKAKLSEISNNTHQLHYTQSTTL